MKHNLEKRFSKFDLILAIVLLAVLVINIAIVGTLRGPGEKKVPKDAVTVTGTGQGKVGAVVVEVAADANNIYSVKVLEQNETPGIGSLAVEQLPGAIVTANSIAVDGVATATVTSDAIKAAIVEALTSAGFDPAAFGYVEPTPAPTPEPTPEPVASDDGAKTAQGSGNGIDGKIVVEVKADANTIYEVNILEQNETPGIGSVAVEKLPGAIVEANSLEVDGITGATVSSTAIKAAVSEALTAMGFDPASYQGAAAAAGDAQTAQGSGNGIDGKIVVEVKADANTIYEVNILEQNETPGIGSVAVEKLPGAIVEANSLEVDGITGATVSSTAIKAAVSEALTAMGFDPASYQGAAAAAGDAQTAQGSGNGIDGKIVVEVKADANTIYEVKILEQNETPGIGSVAVEKLPGAIVEANSLEVDGITGATVSSTAIKTAVSEALTAMGFDPASYQGAAAAAAAPAESAEVELECDVVVVGAGGAGMTAAITASDAGAKVVVLESTALPGGNSVRSTGGMNAAPTEWRNQNEFKEAAGVEATLKKVEKYPDNARIQELGKIVEEQWKAYQENPEGYFDSVELFQLDTLIGGGGKNDPALVKKLAESSADAIAWLDSLDPEIILHNVAAFGGASVKRIHRPVDENGKTISVGAYVVPLLQKNLEERGISIMTETPATEILMDNGEAVGVKAVNGDTVYIIHAKAVVIASGGFGANNDMIKAVRPELDGFITTNAPGIQGQGIQMAQAIGADTVDMAEIQLHPTVHVEGSAAVLITEGLRGDGAILVNQEGLRFYDEVSTRDKVSAAEFEQTGGYAWLIVDSRMSDASNVIQGYIKKGYAVTGETWEELAAAIGAPADVLADTMAKWNACVEAKEDKDFGRVSFANPLDQAPYYAIKVQPGVHHTMGGIKITDNAEVVATDGSVIPGLFAAGEVTGGVHGNNRLGGNAVADFTIFGRISGQSASDFAAAAAPAAAASGDAQTAQGSGNGIDGKIVVEVKADENTIYEVNILEQNETPGIGSVAVEKLPGAIVEANSLEVDGITGATVSSTAIKTAVSEALTAMGFDPASYQGAAAAAPAEKTEVELECDVVVVGAGGAGMTAAITASDAGAKVVVLESTALPGGNSVRSTGGMNAAPTEWRNQNEFKEAAGVEATLKKVEKYPDNARIQELGKIVEEQWKAYQENPDGYFDSVELFQLDTLIGGGGKNDPALVKKLAESSADAIAWLDSLDPEIILHNVAAFGGASVKRIHRPVDENGKTISVGAYVVPLLQKNLEERGISIMTETPATEVLMDNGEAVGVKAVNGDTVYIIHAKAVVIASGGFGANNDMIKAVRPELDGFITTNAPGIQGQGIQMAQAIGADTVDMAEIQLHPTVHVEGSAAVLITEGLRGDGAILVNQEGLRFYDEVSTRDKVSAAEFEQTGGYAWLIVDSCMSDASNVIQGYIKKGYAVTGETWEELAAAIGAPADVLADTMAKWNACVEAKEDKDFGRVSFANPLDQAPYYAIKVQPGVHHTMGGIKITDNAEVVATDGNVIPGLFAAGEVTGGVHGNNRLGGNAVADFTIFGRISGQSAADFAAAAADDVQIAA